MPMPTNPSSFRAGPRLRSGSGPAVLTRAAGLLLACSLSLSLSLVLSLCLAACSQPGPFTRVMLTGVPPQTEKLLVSVTVGGTTKISELKDRSEGFSRVTIDFPAGTRGDLEVSIRAALGNACVIASGAATRELIADEVIELPIALKLEPAGSCGLPSANLSVSVAGSGTVTVNPQGTSCGPSCFTFFIGTQVTLSAMPSGSASFDGWVGGGCPAAGDCQLTLSRDETVVARFSTCVGWCNEQPKGETATLYGIGGTAANSIFVVGAGGTILSFDGAGWRRSPTGVTSGLRGIGISAPGSSQAIIAVGDAGTILGQSGLSWSKLTSSSGENLLAAAGARSSEMFVVGMNGAYLKSKSNTSYSRPTFYQPPGDANGRSISGIAVVPNTGDEQHYAVGSGGLIVRRRRGGVGEDYWSTQDAGTNVDLNGIWCGSDCYAVGNDGTLISNKGGSWKAVATGLSNLPTLRAIYGVTDSTMGNTLHLYAVGDSGTILHLNGATWTQEKVPSNANLFGVWGTAPTNMYAVGEGGAIWHSPR